MLGPAVPDPDPEPDPDPDPEPPGPPLVGFAGGFAVCVVTFATPPHETHKHTHAHKIARQFLTGSLLIVPRKTNGKRIGRGRTWRWTFVVSRPPNLHPAHRRRNLLEGQFRSSQDSCPLVLGFSTWLFLLTLCGNRRLSVHLASAARGNLAERGNSNPTLKAQQFPREFLHERVRRALVKVTQHPARYYSLHAVVTFSGIPR
jgi:hypothetical protein